jgi:hypothetical protein
MTAARHLGAVTLSCARNRFDPVHAERTLSRALTTASYLPLPRTIGIGNGMGSSWTGTRPARVSVPLGKVSAWLTYDKVSKDVEEDNKGLEVKDKGERDNIADDATKASSPKFGSDTRTDNASHGNDDSSNSHPYSDSKRSVHATDNSLLSLFMAVLCLLAGPVAVVLLLGYFAWEVGRYRSRMKTSEPNSTQLGSDVSGNGWPRGNDDSSDDDSDLARPFRLTDSAPLCFLMIALCLLAGPVALVWLLGYLMGGWELTRDLRLMDNAPLCVIMGGLSVLGGPLAILLFLGYVVGAWEAETYRVRMETALPPASPGAPTADSVRREGTQRGPESGTS